MESYQRQASPQPRPTTTKHRHVTKGTICFCQSFFIAFFYLHFAEKKTLFMMIIIVWNVFNYYVFEVDL